MITKTISIVSNMRVEYGETELNYVKGGGFHEQLFELRASFEER